MTGKAEGRQGEVSVFLWDQGFQMRQASLNYHIWVAFILWCIILSSGKQNKMKNAESA